MDNIAPQSADFNPVTTSASNKPRVTAAEVKGDCPSELRGWGERAAAHLKKADKCDEKAEQHRASAGRYLALAADACDEGGFEAFREKFCSDIGRSRAYELRTIAAGKTTIEQVRAKTRERVNRHRAKHQSVTSDVTDSAGPCPAANGNAEDTEQSAEAQSTTAAPIKTPARSELLKFWRVASAEERRACIKYESAVGLLALLKDAPELLTELVNRALGQNIATASRTTKFATASTGRLHVWLRCSEQPDPSAEDIRNMIAAGRAVIRDAQNREITRSNILAAEGKAKIRKGK